VASPAGHSGQRSSPRSARKVPRPRPRAVLRSRAREAPGGRGSPPGSGVPSAAASRAEGGRPGLPYPTRSRALRRRSDGHYGACLEVVPASRSAGDRRRQWTIQRLTPWPQRLRMASAEVLEGLSMAAESRRTSTPGLAAAMIASRPPGPLTQAAGSRLVSHVHREPYPPRSRRRGRPRPASPGPRGIRSRPRETGGSRPPPGGRTGGEGGLSALPADLLFHGLADVSHPGPGHDQAGAVVAGCGGHAPGLAELLEDVGGQRGSSRPASSWRSSRR
jgi:hypothetical protein